MVIDTRDGETVARLRAAGWTVEPPREMSLAEASADAKGALGMMELAEVLDRIRRARPGQDSMLTTMATPFLYRRALEEMAVLGEMVAQNQPGHLLQGPTAMAIQFLLSLFGRFR